MVKAEWLGGENKMDVKEILNKLKQICSKQEKCAADITILLNRWSVKTENHQSIIDQLKSEKYIDDRRYAFAYARDKIKFDHWGITKVKIMLGQKGIDKDITEEIISEIDISEYKQIIESELRKKRKTVKGTPYEIWAKLARYGSSKGYSMDEMSEFLEMLK